MDIARRAEQHPIEQAICSGAAGDGHFAASQLGNPARLTAATIIPYEPGIAIALPLHPATIKLTHYPLEPS